MRIRTRNPWVLLHQFDENDPPEEGEVVPAFPMPEDLTALTVAELDQLIEDATERFDEVHGGDLDAAALSELTELRDAILTLRGEKDRRTTEAEETRAAAEALLSDVHPSDEDDPDAQAVDDPGDDPEAPPADPEDPPTDPPEAVVPDEVIPPERVPVAASSRPPLRDVARRQPPSRGPAPSARRRDRLPITITAAADVPGLQSGSRVDSLDKLADAMHGRARLLKDGSGPVPLCTIDYPIPAEDTVTADRDPMDVLTRLTDVQVLTAAGGWCGPLEPLFNLCRIDAADGLLDIPTFRVRRGGVSVPSPIVMPADLNTLGWTWTNSADIAAAAPEQLGNLALTGNVVTADTDAAHGLTTGQYVTIETSTAAFAFLNGQTVGPITVTDADTFTFPFTHANVGTATAVGQVQVGKPCVRIPCPTWTDYVLQADGICVTHGNLADRSFPELTREYIQMVMNAHMHRISAATIATIAAGSTAVNGVEVGSAASSIFGAADLAAEFYREKYRMARGAVLESVFPQWTPVIMRADISARTGRDTLSISDQEIAAEWSMRRIRPQYVQDYQPLAAATAYPATLDFLVYPAGTWGRGTGGSLDLGVTRDSTLNATNDFTAAWTEEFSLVAKLCAESFKVTSTLAVNGITGCCP